MKQNMPLATKQCSYKRSPKFIGNCKKIQGVVFSMCVLYLKHSGLNVNHS